MTKFQLEVLVWSRKWIIYDLHAESCKCSICKELDVPGAFVRNKAFEEGYNRTLNIGLKIRGGTWTPLSSK